MWQQPLTIVSAHVDFQLSATRQPPLTPLPPSLNRWELGGGLKIEPAAACSRELILHATPVPLAHHQTVRQTLVAALSWPPLASCTMCSI